MCLRELSFTALQQGDIYDLLRVSFPCADQSSHYKNNSLFVRFSLACCVCLDKITFLSLLSYALHYLPLGIISRCRRFLLYSTRSGTMRVRLHWVNIFFLCNCRFSIDWPCAGTRTFFIYHKSSTHVVSCCTSAIVVVVVLSHIPRIGCQPEKPTLHGGQSRSLVIC